MNPSHHAPRSGAAFGYFKKSNIFVMVHLPVLIHKSPLFPFTLRNNLNTIKKQIIREEYLHFIEKFEIKYENQYLFE